MMPNTVTIYMDKHTVTWKKHKTTCFNAINKIRRKWHKMWEYKTDMQSTYQLLGRMHLGVDRKKSTDKKL